MKKKILLMGLLSTALLTGCTSDIPQDTEISSEIIESTTQENLEEIKNNNEKLIDLLAENTSDNNVVVSDLSINMALSMALEGAENETKKEIENYLGIKKEENSLKNKNILESIKNNENANLEIANSFWYNNSLIVKESFIENLKYNYKAKIESVEMSNPETATKINDWCSEKTHKLIPEIVTSDAIQDKESILINAIYFKANWLEEFFEKLTKKETFEGLNENTTVDMMHSVENIYLENENAIGFIKPYYNQYAFVGILPKNKGDFNISDIDIQDLLKTQTNNYDVNIGLPKFKIEFSTSLVKPLQSLGINKSFNAQEADFTGIADNLFVSDIIHKTYISVDEIGTEAAAVTAIITDGTAFIEPKKEKDVILNRPFAFVIINTQTNDILFTGKISNIK